MSSPAMDDIMPSWVLENPIAWDPVHLAVVFVVAVLVYAVARWWPVAAIRRLVKRGRVTWDDALVEARIFIRLAHIAPALASTMGSSSFRIFMSVWRRCRNGWRSA